MKLTPLKMKKITLLKLSLGGLALLAAITLTANVLNYVDLERNALRSYQSLELTEKLAEASNLNQLIHDLNTTRTDEARQRLNWKLAHDLSAIKFMATTAQPKQKNVVEYVVGNITRDEKSHSSDFLAVTQPTCVEVE